MNMLEIIVNIILLFNIAEATTPVTFPPVDGGSKEPAY
jgi:hypothetical protein